MFPNGDQFLCILFHCTWALAVSPLCFFIYCIWGISFCTDLSSSDSLHQHDTLQVTSCSRKLHSFMIFWNSSLSLLHMHRVYPVIITWIHKLFPEFCIWDSAARNISVSMSFLHLEGPLRYRLRSGFWVRFNFFIFMNIHILFCRNHRQINIFTTGREFLSPCNHI